MRWQSEKARAVRRRRISPAWLVMLVLGAVAGGVQPADPPRVLVLEVHGAIGPATADYVGRGLERAAREGAALVVIGLDTPGGLDTAMRAIIRDILASPVPVAVYVAPPGARAASAGTYILYAAHVAAMAPGTNVGAATPVQVGGLPGLPSPDEPGRTPQRPHGRDAPGGDDGEPAPGAGEAEEEGGGHPAAMQRKLVNDAVAYLRSLAELRGRNADWAERAVREAASLSAGEALREGVIDLVAPDLDALLEALDGRTVNVAGGERLLRTGGASVIAVPPDWRTRLLAVITNPNVAYLLMLIGVYGLIFELANPGFILPGVVGGIALLLALFAFQVLPVNYAGVALVLLGLAFMVGELFVPSFGALGLGGAVAFVVGSVILFETEGTGYQVSRVLVAGVGLASALALVALVAYARRVHRRRPVIGPDELIGARGEAREPFDRHGHGHVWVHGELWAARARTHIRRGQAVRVTGREGLTVLVEPLQEER